MDSKEHDELLRKLETDIWDVKGGIMQVLQNQRRQEKGGGMNEEEKQLLADLGELAVRLEAEVKVLRSVIMSILLRTGKEHEGLLNAVIEGLRSYQALPGIQNTEDERTRIVSESAEDFAKDITTIRDRLISGGEL